jgi:hypothetical protein
MYTLVVIVENARNFNFLAEKSTTSTDGWVETRHWECVLPWSKERERERARASEREREERQQRRGVESVRVEENGGEIAESLDTVWKRKERRKEPY